MRFRKTSWEIAVAKQKVIQKASMIPVAQSLKINGLKVK